MAKSDKLYGKSPSLGRDGTTGKVSVKHQTANSGETDDAGGPTSADSEDMGLAGEGKEQAGTSDHMHVRHMHERHEMHHKHTTEVLQLHRRHELEHANHNIAGETDKKQVHRKHEAEHKAMHERHHEELKTMHRRHEKEFGSAGKQNTTEKTGGEDKAKVESDKKD